MQNFFGFKHVTDIVGPPPYQDTKGTRPKVVASASQAHVFYIDNVPAGGTGAERLSSRDLVIQSNAWDENDTILIPQISPGYWLANGATVGNTLYVALIGGGIFTQPLHRTELYFSSRGADDPNWQPETSFGTTNLESTYKKKNITARGDTLYIVNECHTDLFGQCDFFSGGVRLITFVPGFFGRTEVIDAESHSPLQPFVTAGPVGVYVFWGHSN